MKNVIIFDTTLRDGEQAPGCQLNTVEKIEVAKMLESMKVDVIEAGFPISSPGDLQSVQEISKAVPGPTIAALARAIHKDIDAAAEALKFAKKKRIHTFISSSDIHIEGQFRSTREKIMEQGIDAIRYAKQFADDVEFSAMDAGRTENTFLAKFIEAAIKAGATTVNIPDTTGYCLPNEFGEKIKYLFDHVAGINDVIVSVHCHNDLGMATANAIAAVQNGARQIEVTVNGVGERAGNTSLEEAVMTLHTRQDIGVITNINTKKIYPASRLVSRLMRSPVQANKAIVGRNAFAHSSGIHQNGVLKSRNTYEIINPKDVGIKDTSLALTARSGRAALKHHLERLSYEVSNDQLDDIYKKFLELADKKKGVVDDDLRILMGDQAHQDGMQLESIEVTSGTKGTPKAIIALKVGKTSVTSTKSGDGPIDAAYKAINAVAKKPVQLEEYLVQAMTGGSDDTGKVHVEISHNDQVYYGFGADTDIIVASVKAYLDALNKVA
jgi:2-isopropylmalate synthase